MSPGAPATSDAGMSHDRDDPHARRERAHAVQAPSDTLLLQEEAGGAFFVAHPVDRKMGPAEASRVEQCGENCRASDAALADNYP